MIVTILIGMLSMCAICAVGVCIFMYLDICIYSERRIWSRAFYLYNDPDWRTYTADINLLKKDPYAYRYLYYPN